MGAPLRVIFAGTPEFARAALERLHAAGHVIALVMTQPDRPAGRGMKLQASPVKQYAQAQGLPVAQPLGLRLQGKYPQDAQAAQAAIAAAQADVMVVAAYGLILPQWVLDAPRWGCLNLHASLLPRWRGAAPIHRAIEAGDAETGITLMQMDAGLDTGDMLQVQRLPIEPTDTTATLHDKLADLGARMIVDAMPLLAAGTLVRTPQPEDGVTYAHKIEKSEAEVDWSLPAPAIERRLRAFDPFPGATSSVQGEAVKLWRAHCVAAPVGAPAGTILAVDAAGVHVACGEGALCLTQLQRAGGKRLAAADFLRGFPLAPGQRFGAAA
jgi:methionyl-tRNA formyltransferase